MLTVLLATRNRAPLLGKVLRCYCDLRAPAAGWKLLVVDNGSTDGTQAVIDSFASRLPLRSVKEPEPGKNRALNAGVPLADGELTVLTDDDVFPHPDWLLELERAGGDRQDFAVFGGTILPRWEAPPPHWVRWIDPRPVFTLTDEAQREGPLPPGLVFGPNMAVRTALFRAGLRFDAAVGPRGASYPMGSETELMQRLDRRGYRAWFAPRAVVEHFIRREQLEQRWVLDRAVRFGRGKCRLERDGARQAGGRRRRVRPRARREMLRECVLMAAARLMRREEALFRSRWRFNYWRGQWIEAGLLAAEGDDAAERPMPAVEAKPPT